jgi:hypothetical protein
MRDRVQRGARLLDRERPDWIEKVNSHRLLMSDGKRCIVGQTFMNGLKDPYNEGLDKLGITEEDYHPAAFIHGFDLEAYEYPTNEFETGEAWSILAELWIAEIDKRKVPA